MSKFVWTFPVRTTTGQEMVNALKTMFASGRKPTHLRSDQGTEFVNKNVKTFLKKEDIIVFVTHNTVKASYAERAIKTIKSKLIRYLTRKQSRRWVDVLSNITESYNKTYHRSIKRTPQSVKPEHSPELWKIQYQQRSQLSTNTRSQSVSKKKPSKSARKTSLYKFKVGDLVRVFFYKKTISTRIRRTLVQRTIRHK